MPLYSYAEGSSSESGDSDGDAEFKVATGGSDSDVCMGGGSSDDGVGGKVAMARKRQRRRQQRAGAAARQRASRGARRRGGGKRRPRRARGAAAAAALSAEEAAEVVRVARITETGRPFFPHVSPPQQLKEARLREITESYNPTVDVCAVCDAMLYGRVRRTGMVHRSVGQLRGSQLLGHLRARLRDCRVAVSGGLRAAYSVDVPELKGLLLSPGGVTGGGEEAVVTLCASCFKSLSSAKNDGNKVRVWLRGVRRAPRVDVDVEVSCDVAFFLCLARAWLCVCVCVCVCVRAPTAPQAVTGERVVCGRWRL